MEIGFTGSRHGMTDRQRDSLIVLFRNLDMTAFRHGDCVGADAQAADLAHTILSAGAVTVHPPSDDTHQAHADRPGNVVLPRKTHFARNRAIVAACDVLIAAPNVNVELDHGGTFYTIGHARKCGRRFLVVWPDGAVSDSPPHPASAAASVQPASTVR